MASQSEAKKKTAENQPDPWNHQQKKIVYGVKKLLLRTIDDDGRRIHLCRSLS